MAVGIINCPMPDSISGAMCNGPNMLTIFAVKYNTEPRTPQTESQRGMSLVWKNRMKIINVPTLKTIPPIIWSHSPEATSMDA